MQICWRSDSNRRPTIGSIHEKSIKIEKIEVKNLTEIIKSSDIRPITTNYSDTSGSIFTRNLSSSEKGN